MEVALWIFDFFGAPGNKLKKKKQLSRTVQQKQNLSAKEFMYVQSLENLLTELLN